ncbi:DUF3253 domain-containing protein [Mucilaginibacter gynuensis]|uniref:DUF3253 domain-containing protein n=1 Tax=Mucilaginibacter gynuensis TaxID=1302236 RepID=A0ABP8GSD0_9SPHI
MSVKPDIAKAILQSAAERGALKTTCPSEVARALFPSDWRSHMGEVRGVAFQLQEKGKVVITQKGMPVTGEPVKGPIRIGLKL